MKEGKGKSRSHPFQYLQHIPLKTELFEKKKEEKTAHTGSEMRGCVCVCLCLRANVRVDGCAFVFGSACVRAEG